MDHGEKYENVMSNRANITSRVDIENMVNDGLGVIIRDNTEEPNVEAKTIYKMLEGCEKSLLSWLCFIYKDVFHSCIIASKCPL